MLQFLKNLHPSVIGLKLLTLKTVALLTLLSGQRVSMLHQFRLSQMQRTPKLFLIFRGYWSSPDQQKGTCQLLIMLSLMMLLSVPWLPWDFISVPGRSWWMLPFMMSSSCVIETLMDPQPEIPSLDGWGWCSEAVVLTWTHFLPIVAGQHPPPKLQLLVYRWRGFWWQDNCGIGSLAWPSVCLWTTSPGWSMSSEQFLQGLYLVLCCVYLCYFWLCC